MKKFLIAAVIIVCATGIAQATIIIDDFTKNGTPNNDITIGPGTNPTGDLTAARTGPSANIMGANVILLLTEVQETLLLLIMLVLVHLLFMVLNIHPLLVQMKSATGEWNTAKALI